MEFFKDFTKIRESLQNTISIFSSTKDESAPCEETPSETPNIRNIGQVQYLFHRGQLNIEHKRVYDIILRGLEQWNNEIKFSSSLDFEAIKSIYYDVLNDNADLFYISNEISVSRAGSICSITPTYFMDKNEYERTQRIFDDIIDTLRPMMSGDPFHDELIIHDYVLNNTTYPDKKTSNRCHYAVGALIDHVSVCDGTSKATAYLMTHLGILCSIISGTLVGDSTEHSWNIIRIKNNNYHLDVTNNIKDGKIVHFYYNLSDRMASRSHIWKDDTNCTDETHITLPYKHYIVENEAELITFVNDCFNKRVTFFIIRSMMGPLYNDDKVHDVLNNCLSRQRVGARLQTSFDRYGNYAVFVKYL